MSLYIIYIIRLKNPIKRHFCHLMCKNAAEAERNFFLFAIYRKNFLSFQFLNIVFLIYQFEFKFYIRFF